MDLLVEAALKEALAQPGCAVCRAGEEAADRYLRFLLHESINDGSARRRLLDAWGFCRRHAWHLQRLEHLRVRDGLGTAILGEALVEAQQMALDESFGAARPEDTAVRDAQRRLRQLRRALTPKAACPACLEQSEHESYVVSVLLGALDDGSWRERVSCSHGLCLPHLRGALEREDRPAQLTWLLSDHRRRLAELLGDLKEYIRRHDYRFAAEPPGREHDAFARATALLAGTWFDLPGMRPSE